MVVTTVEVVRNVCRYAVQLRCRPRAGFVDKKRCDEVARILVRLFVPTCTVPVCEAGMEDDDRCYALLVQRATWCRGLVQVFRKMYVMADGSSYVFSYLVTGSEMVSEMVS